jgi:hypothetical protein
VHVARPALALLACLLLLGLGCDTGDGGGREGATERQRLSKAEFVRRADALCAEYERRLARLRQPRDVEALADFVDEALPIVREAIARLRALEPPAELEPEVERWLERNDENVERMEALRDAARAGDETRVQTIASAASENEREADELAREIGLRDCAREGSGRRAPSAR